MTHDVAIERRRTDNQGARVLVRLDITELDSAGVEEFDPTTEQDDDERGLSGTPSGLILPQSTLDAINVLEWEDETKIVLWDTVDEELKVKSISDGSDAANDSSVGEVLVEVIGSS